MVGYFIDILNMNVYTCLYIQHLIPCMSVRIYFNVMMILKVIAGERKLSLSRGLKAQLALEYWKVGDNKSYRL
ncbi:hypothetical protein CXF93_06275 [Moritella sp. Urea-trap-13]|nr:hypothetical protein CXF93_06275 [Moritella sp. Urea-trap-13]